MTDDPTSGDEPMGADRPSQPEGGFGARWCDGHAPRPAAWECRHQRARGRGQCHQLAVVGTDSCDDHCGRTLAEQRARGEANLLLASVVAEQVRRHPGEVLLEACHLAHALMDRAAQVPVSSLSGEVLDRLALSVDRAARIAKAALDADAQDRLVRHVERIDSETGELMAARVLALLERLGRADAEGKSIAAQWVRELEVVA